MYAAYARQERPINVVNVDSTLDFGGDPQEIDGRNWLNALILPEGGHLFDLTHLGHQRYRTDGDTLQLMERMHFDAVRLGRGIGTLRLGGWVDIYVPADVDIIPLAGQTLIGSETVLGRFGDAGAVERKDETPEETPAPEPKASEPEEVEGELVIDEEDELTLDALTEDDAEAATEDGDVSEMFARLRKEAKKIQDGD